MSDPIPMLDIAKQEWRCEDGTVYGGIEFADLLEARRVFHNARASLGVSDVGDMIYTNGLAYERIK